MSQSGVHCETLFSKPPICSEMGRSNFPYEKGVIIYGGSRSISVIQCNLYRGYSQVSEIAERSGTGPQRCVGAASLLRRGFPFSVFF